MRVLLLNQYYAPDEAPTAQLLADVGEGLARAGFEVSAVCGVRGYVDPGRRYPARESRNGVRVHRTWTSGFGRRNRVGRLIDYVTFLIGAGRRLLLRRRPDVVIALSTPPLVAALAWLLLRWRGTRTVYWVMDVYPQLAFELGVVRRGSPTGWMLARVARWILRRSDRVVALGDCMARRLADNRAPNVVVIPGWADGETIRPQPPERSGLRGSRGWDGRLVVLYSGNMGLVHEFDTVLAAAELLRERPEILFAFVGGGPRRAEVQSEVGRRGLPNVEFRPYAPLEELRDSLAAGDLHLVTLRRGAHGLVVPSKIYGALAAGRPTVYVGPAQGEVVEIVRAGSCGVCIAEGDGEKLARAILEYQADPARRERHGRAARELFVARFTKQRGVSSFVELVESLAA